MQICSSGDHTTGGHTQLDTSSNHSQPVPVSSGVIPPAPAATTPGSTAPLHHLTNDHRHGHIPAGLGMIPSLRANLASTEPLQPVSDHSQPVPISFGVISPACTDSVSGAPDNHMQPRPMNDRSQPVPVDSGAILPAHADLVSESTTSSSRFRPTSDYSHEHLPTDLGVISSPTNLSSTGEVSPPHTTSAFATTTSAFATTTSASTTTISQPHPTYVLRSTTSASPSAPEFSSVRLHPPSADLAQSPSFDLNSADLAPSPSFNLNSSAHQSCPSPTDLASFPPLSSSS